MTNDVVIGRLRARRGKGRLAEAGLCIGRLWQILHGIRAGSATVPLIVVGYAKVISAAESRVVRLAGVAGRKVAGELIAGIEPGIDLRCKGRALDGRRRLVLQHDDEDMIVARYAFDIHRRLLRFLDRDGRCRRGRISGQRRRGDTSSTYPPSWQQARSGC